MNPGQGRYFPPEDIDISINLAVKDFYRQEYIHFEETQEITDTLGFFKAFVQPALSGGNADLPADFYHLTDIEAVLSDSSKAPLHEVKDGAWSERKNTAGFLPTAKYPICRQFARKLECLPLPATDIVGVLSVNMYYLRKPSEAKFNYSDADGYGYVFVPAGSVDVDWPEIDHPRILLKALGYLGIPTQNINLEQMEMMKKQANNNA